MKMHLILSRNGESTISRGVGLDISLQMLVKELPEKCQWRAVPTHVTNMAATPWESGEETGGQDASGSPEV
jgi:hypothetical protein